MVGLANLLSIPLDATSTGQLKCAREIAQVIKKKCRNILFQKSNRCVLCFIVVFILIISVAHWQIGRVCEHPCITKGSWAVGRIRTHTAGMQSFLNDTIDCTLQWHVACLNARIQIRANFGSTSIFWVLHPYHIVIPYQILHASIKFLRLRKQLTSRVYRCAFAKMRWKSIFVVSDG